MSEQHEFRGLKPAELEDIKELLAEKQFPREKQDFLLKVADMVVLGDRENTKNVVKDGLDNQTATAFEILHYGLSPGINVLGVRYERRQIFVPEVLMMVDAMQGAMEIVLPPLKEEIAKKGSLETPGKVVIGVVEGDIHDIGKSIVAALLEAAGFEVIDLGRDVPAEDFVRTAAEQSCQIIAASTLMTPTLEVMEEIEEKLRETGKKGTIKTVIGGGATSKEFAEEVGIDAWAKDAVEGVDTIKRMVQEIKVAMEEVRKRAEEEK